MILNFWLSSAFFFCSAITTHHRQSLIVQLNLIMKSICIFVFNNSQPRKKIIFTLLASLN